MVGSFLLIYLSQSKWIDHLLIQVIGDLISFFVIKFEPFGRALTCTLIAFDLSWNASLFISLS